MNEKLKKILMVLGFVGIVILIAFLIWLVFFKSTSTNVTTPIDDGTTTTNNGTTTLPTTSTSGPGTTEVVVEEVGNDTTEDISGLTLEEIMQKYKEQDLKNVGELPTISEKNTNIVEVVSDVASGGTTKTNIVSKGNNTSPIISGNNLISFNSSDGSFYKIDLSTGDKNLLTNDTFKGASNIVWAPTTNLAVIEFPDGTNVVYDFTKTKQYVLPKEWYDFSFQKDGEKLAFMIDSTNYDNRWLAISNIDGSGLTGIEPLGNNADKVDVMYSPNEQMIALSRTGDPVGMFQQSVLLIGLNHENFNDLLVEGRGFHPLWSKSGDKIVYDAYNKETSYKPNIWAVNATADNAGTNSKSLNLSTWVSKCSFNSDGTLLYCAVPRDMPEGAAMFPEMMSEAKIYDDIYVVNIYTGYKKLVAKPNQDVLISKVLLSNDDKILYYQDSVTGDLYSMKLK